MPTPLSHALVGVTLTQLTPRELSRTQSVALLTVLAASPDLDILGFHLGISYGDMLGHRGLTHSCAWAVLASAALTSAFGIAGRWRLRQILHVWLVALVAALSHPLLDAATNGGLGVGLWLPFSDDRFFFAVRPIVVSPINPARLLAGARPVLASEAVWIWTPLLLLEGVVTSFRLTARWWEARGRPCDRQSRRRRRSAA